MQNFYPVIRVMTIMLIDAHCHLADLSPEELSGTLERAAESGVGLFVAIGVGPTLTECVKTVAIAKQLPQVFAAIAVHPHDAKTATPEVMEQIKNLILSNDNVCAVGETGLDYHYMNSPKEVQKAVLRQFARLAHEVKRPLIIHDRDCGEDCVKILEEEGADQISGVVHCFTGSRELAQRYLNLGFAISFTGIITFKNAQSVRAVAKDIPLNRMMVETDSPFLAPEPFRGRKNEPAYVKYVAQAIANLKLVDVETVARETTATAKKVFKLYVDSARGFS